VTDRHQIDAAVSSSLDRCESVEALANNAGLAPVGAVEELDDRQLRDLT
jgi:NADP-dependent 3-hydroxy acid dehydrogenase YdfG